MTIERNALFLFCALAAAGAAQAGEANIFPDKVGVRLEGVDLDGKPCSLVVSDLNREENKINVQIELEGKMTNLDNLRRGLVGIVLPEREQKKLEATTEKLDRESAKEWFSVLTDFEGLPGAGTGGEAYRIGLDKDGKALYASHMSRHFFGLSSKAEACLIKQ